MQLETQRLTLVPLTADQLVLLTENLPALEAELGFTYEAEPIEGFFDTIVRGQAEIAKKDPKNYLWHSFWLLIRKSDFVAVGSADFKNVPDENGEVEIGYGLGKAHEHNGYMTEAVATMCRWALKQDNVRRVTAETDADGFASQRILTRCGFCRDTRKQGESLWWVLP